MQMKLIKQTLLLSLSGLMLAWVLGSGCSKEEVLTPKADYSCIETGTRPASTEAPCSDGKRFVKGLCVEARCDAGEMAPNCCPGQFCDPGGSCQTAASRIVECEGDADCSDGQRCLDRPHIQHSGSTTTFSADGPPWTTGACPNGVAFNERCVNTLPAKVGVLPPGVTSIPISASLSPPYLKVTRAVHKTAAAQRCWSTPTPTTCFSTSAVKFHVNVKHCLPSTQGLGDDSPIFLQASLEHWYQRMTRPTETSSLQPTETFLARSNRLSM